MKGKGKKEKETDADDCPLQFLDFQQIDHTKHCPRFTAVLQRNDDESVGFEDLDALQLELEMLLVSVVKRQTQLRTEMDALNNWHDSKHRDRKSPIKSQPETIGKRSKQTEDKPNKKFKESPTAAMSTGKSHVSRHHKVRFTDTDYIDAHHEVVPKKIPIKNDIPDQFWKFIEPYCCEITSEHIKVISDMIKAYDDDGEYYKIPNLGKHYSLKLEHEDLLNDRKEGTKHGTSAADKKKGLSASNSSSGGSSATHSSGKSTKKVKETSEATFGALTQRLVSCLIEENLLSNADSKNGDNENGIGKGKERESNGDDNGHIFKSLNLGNTVQLERRIRKELEDHGILTMDDILNNIDNISNDDDEILHELKRCQTELKHVSTKNQAHLKRLLSTAKKEMSKQDMSKKLQNADGEVMEAYRRIVSAKQKKRSPTKKEKEFAVKALKERDNILKQMS